MKKNEKCFFIGQPWVVYNTHKKKKEMRDASLIGLIDGVVWWKKRDKEKINILIGCLKFFDIQI